jgi:pimeloyl-ACP methyl ester carboxylesterase
LNRRLGLALAAAGVAGAGAFVHTRVRAERRAHPARGGFAAGLHYVEAGFGPPAVFLHGMGSMLQDFELCGVFSRAADTHRAVAFDRPGYGYSTPGANLPSEQAAMLHKAFRRLGIAQPLIVAHSLGTLVAIAYALRYPDDVRGLVLASGYYYPTVRPDALVLVPPAIPLIGTLMRHTISPLIGRLLWPAWLKMLFAPREVPRYMEHFPTWQALQPKQLHAVGREAALAVPVTAAMRKVYLALRVPVAIVAGAQDRYLSTRAHSRRLHETLANSTYLEVPGAGHMVHHAAPDAIVDVMQSLA